MPPFRRREPGRAAALTVLLALLPPLLPAEEALPVMVITAPRWPEAPRRTLRAVTAVDAQTLLWRKPRSVAEALREEPGLLVQQTMPGHAAVSVRGLIGKDNLVVVDGVRLNNATTENIQSMSIVDPESVESVEVLRGPASIVYGGDALGGVVYLVPKMRQDFSKPSAMNGRLAATYRSADRGRVGRAELSGNRGGIGFHGGWTSSSFGDLDLGGRFGKAVPAAYRARAGDLALEWRREEAVVRALYQHVLQSDVPRYDQYFDARRFGSAGSFEEFIFDKERRDMAVLEAKAGAERGPAKELEAKAWWHRQESRSRQRRTGSFTREERRDVVTTLGGRLQTILEPAKDWSLAVGADGAQDYLGSSRTDRNLATGLLTARDADSNYPDGSRYTSFGAFLFNQLRLGERWGAEAGTRLARVWQSSTLRGGPLAGTAVTDAFSSWTGGASLAFRPIQDWRLSASAWQGFRAPNFNETVALKSGPSGTDVPSPGLSPEKSLGFELGLKKEAGAFRQDLVLFHMLLKDRIDRVPGTFNGSSTLAGTPVFQRANSSGGYIQGVEWEGRLDLPAGFHLGGSGSWMYGRDTSAGTALTKMPPPMAVASAGWQGTGALKPRAETFVRMAARQRRLSPSDLRDPRIDPSGASAWASWNARAGLAPNSWSRAHLSVENMLDRAYREHASGVDAPGVNVIAGVELFF